MDHCCAFEAESNPTKLIQFCYSPRSDVGGLQNPSVTRITLRQNAQDGGRVLLSGSINMGVRSGTVVADNYSRPHMSRAQKYSSAKEYAAYTFRVSNRE